MLVNASPASRGVAAWESEFSAPVGLCQPVGFIFARARLNPPSPGHPRLPPSFCFH